MSTTKILLTIIFLHFAFLQAKNPPTTFSKQDQPKAPDYSNEKYWSALPFKKDKADMIPKSESCINDSLKEVDVFYIYPTLYMKGKTWNADVDNKKLNKRIDKFPVKYQASVFNVSARVYAPRYRQAIVAVYKDSTAPRKEVLDFAYQDVKNAFEYYLKNYNNGRPIIIASHSQGSTHARELIKEYFDTPETKSKLVCAYVVGFAMYPEEYKVLTPCEDANENNCYVTWASFKDGFEYQDTLKDFLVGKVCVNPISWKMDTINAVGKGGFLLNENRKKLFQTSAKIHENYLWVKTNMTFVRKTNTLHLLDYNLYWFDIRQNVADRVKTYLSNKH